MSADITTTQKLCYIVFLLHDFPDYMKFNSREDMNQYFLKPIDVSERLLNFSCAVKLHIP